MSLKSELKQELKSRNIAFKDLNKKANKQAKAEILARLVRRGAVEGHTKTSLAKELRSIQINKKKLTFSNQQIRDLYDRTVLAGKKKSPTALSKTARPRHEKIANTKRKHGKPTDAYFYIVKAYLGSRGKGKGRGRKVPSNKNIIRYTGDERYDTTQDFVLISETILNRNEVMDLANSTVTGDESEYDSDISFNASGLNNIDFKVHYIIAIEYRTVVKDF